MRKRIKNLLMKASVTGIGTVLTVLAVLFANSPCHGDLYEPEVPEALRR